MSFTIFYNEKTPSKAIKTRSSNSRKNDIFPKELTHGFASILERKNAFLAYNNKKFKKSKNWHFSKGVNPWFSSKNGYFSNFFFLGNIGQENELYDILEWKNAFLGYKNKKFK